VLGGGAFVAAFVTVVVLGQRHWDAAATIIGDSSPRRKDVALRLRWAGRVTSSTWDGAPVDAQCFLGAALHSDRQRLTGVELGLACEGKLIDQAGSDSGHFACNAVERPGLGAGNYEYDVVCQTQEGASTTTAWLLDTRVRRFVLERHEPHARLELELRREDGVAKGHLFARSFGRLSFRGGQKYIARVTEQQGEPPFELPEACDLSVLPTPLPESPCRVVVECEGQLLYGGFDQGFVNCAIGDDGPTLLGDEGSTAEDGDPRLRINLLQRRAEVSEAQTWKVGFALEAK
jgi:hypothetical protein